LFFFWEEEGEAMIRKRRILKSVVLFLLVLPLVHLPVQSHSKEPVVLKGWSLSWPEPIEQWRILSKDLEKLGIQVDMRTGALNEWTGEIIGRSNPYHLVTMTWTGSPERMEPSWYLTEFFHSSRAKPGGRNYGYFVSEEYDRVVDAQLTEMDNTKRQKLIRTAQEIVAKNNLFFPVYFRDYVQVYNTERIEGVVSVMGSGIGYPYSPWTFLRAKPKAEVREPRIVNLHDLITLNPFGAAEPQTMGWLRLTYDTLAKRDDEGKIIPWAAESWQTPDNRTIDVVLREGMKFHDGKAATVEDVKFTFDYIVKWKFPTFSEVWRNVESVQVLDGRRVRIKLLKPYSPFSENILLNVFVAPRHIWEKIPEAGGISNPMDWPNTLPLTGSGPYQMVEWKKKEYFHLKANKNHWMAPHFDGLYYIYVPTAEGMMALLEKKQAEIIGFALDSAQGKKLETFSHLKMVTAPNFGITEIRPNLKMKPMDDPNFRRAFQHAVDRKKMLDVVFQGHGTIAHNTPITPGIKFWNNPDIPAIEFDLNKTREILKSAGYTWDEKGRLCYP
jgi:peptide/nickel transport system substrate-binding protein